MREEEDLDRDRKACMEGDDDDEQDTRCFGIGCSDDRITVTDISTCDACFQYVTTYRFLNKKPADRANPTATKA